MIITKFIRIVIISNIRVVTTFFILEINILERRMNRTGLNSINFLTIVNFVTMRN